MSETTNSDQLTDAREASLEHKIRDEFMDRARNQTLETLPDFLRELAEHEHGYGSICIACAAAAVAAASAVDNAPCGGITGFQSGVVFWEFAEGWGTIENSDLACLVKRGELLYPQYDNRLTELHELDPNEHELLVQKAKTLLAESGETAHAEVRKRWELVASGKLPSPWRVAAPKGGAS